MKIKATIIHKLTSTNLSIEKNYREFLLPGKHLKT